MLRNRRSIRSFTGAPVPDEDWEQVLAATQQAPTSINAQGISLVVVRDEQTKARLAELAGGQQHVADAEALVVFVMDSSRTAGAVRRGGAEQLVHVDPEAVLAGAVDAGIALASFQTAAHALGYGTCAIGGIRKDPQAVVDLLGLPPLTFPLVGSTIGVPDPDKLPQVKPRVPRESYAMTDRYDADAVARGAEDYDATLRQWWDQQGLTHMGTYSHDVARTYQHVYYPQVAPVLRAQGFLTAEPATQS